MKLCKWITIMLMSCSLVFTACEDDEYDINDVIEEVEFTLPVAVVNGSGVEVTSIIDMDDDQLYMGFGFCYSQTNQEPTIYDATTSCIPENKVMTTVLSDLEDNKIYYIRAYATLYPTGVIYSNPIIVTVGTVETPVE